MLLITTHNSLLFKKREIWFYDGEPVKEGHYNTYCYPLRPPPSPCDRELREFTSLLSLSLTENELFRAMHRTTRYQVRRSEQLGLTYECIVEPTITDCNKLIAAFSGFASKKNILPINSRRIYALQKIKHLIITQLSDDAGPLFTHVYLFDKRRISLLYTFNNRGPEIQNRNANKLHHWRDILTFKKMAFETYDFGGINEDTVPGITRFKLSFGGSIEPVNSCTRMAPYLRLFDKIYRSLT